MSKQTHSPVIINKARIHVQKFTYVTDWTEVNKFLKFVFYVLFINRAFVQYLQPRQESVYYDTNCNPTSGTGRNVLIHFINWKGVSGIVRCQIFKSKNLLEIMLVEMFAVKSWLTFMKSMTKRMCHWILSLRYQYNSSHSFATKYVLQILTSTDWPFLPFAGPFVGAVTVDPRRNFSSCVLALSSSDFSVCLFSVISLTQRWRVFGLSQSMKKMSTVAVTVSSLTTWIDFKMTAAIK